MPASSLRAPIRTAEHYKSDIPAAVLERLEFREPRLPAGRPAAATPTRLCAVSIVIPVFNSEETISRLVQELVAGLGELYRLQIVLVDDGSHDRSPIICRGLHELHPEMVDFVALSRNFGEHNAVMAGLNRVTGEYCVIMDDDFQNAPDDVCRLLKEIQKGGDVVYVRYASKRHSLGRNLGSFFHNWVATRALGKPAGLYLSSFKAISRFVEQEAIRYTGPDPYLDAIILKTTRKFSVIPAGHQPREHGKSNYTIAKLISLWGNMIVAFSSYPLRLLGIFGMLMTLVGIGIGVYTFGGYIFDGLETPDRLDRLSAELWFFRGINLLFISIVGEYVGRIYRLMKHEPQFIVRDVHARRR